MKKNLPLLWFSLSALIISYVFFTSGDELFSRKELLITAILALTGSLFLFFLLRHISDSNLHRALTVSMIFSFFFCIWLEKNHPLLIIPCEETTVSIPSTKNGKVSLSWAYWSNPDIEINDEADDWIPYKDISNGMLQFQGDWLRDGKINTCTGSCELKLAAGIHFHRPILCFEGDVPIDINKADGGYTVTPGVPLKFFSSGVGLSRQLVFVIFFLSTCGILLLPAGCISALLPERNSANSSCIRTDFLTYTGAFLIPIFLSGLICYLLKLWPFGEKTFLITDMQVQYADYLIYLKQILQGNHSLFYSFCKSIGDDFLGLYAYYLGNPLNWIAALFPIRYFPAAISTIVILRYGLCGLTAAIYFRKVFQTKGETLIFSTAYTLISLHFVITEHIQLRDGAILLPLILMGIEWIIRKNRATLYIASLCSALLISYYSAYQICFYCVLYFVFRQLMENHWSWKQTGTFLGSSFFSAALCAVFLVPVAVQLTKGMKTFDPSQFTFTLNMRFSELAGKLFNSAFDMDQTLTSGFPNIFCGLFVTTGIPLFFLNRHITKREKLLIAGMLVVFIMVMQIRALNLVLHGFNEPVWWPYRYSFIICLFLITMTLRCYQERDGITVTGWLFSALIDIGFLICIRSLHFSWFSEDSYYLNILISVCMIILWLISSRTKTKIFMSFLIISGVDLICNGWMILSEKTAYQRSETVSDFQQFFSDNLPVIQALNEYDSEFFRTEKTYSRDANDAMSLGYHGISHYSSTLNFNLMKFLPKMGYRYYPWRFLYGEGSTIASDSLLSIRYLISDQPSVLKPYTAVFSEAGKTVFSNPYSLPISFAAVSNQAALSGNNPFESQNIIFRNLTGEEKDIYSEVSISSFTFENLRPVQDQPHCFERINSDSESKLIWSIVPENKDSLYLYLPARYEYKTDILINDTYFSGYYDGKGIPVLPLGHFTPDSPIELSLTPQENIICIDDFLLYSENESVIAEYAGKLNRSSLSLNKESDTKLTGSITSETDGYLFFSIPYDKGWKIKIDGTYVSPERAFDVFLSTPVISGTHDWEITYHPEGLLFGAIITGTAILISAVYFCVSNKRRETCWRFRRTSKESNQR